MGYLSGAVLCLLVPSQLCSVGFCVHLGGKWLLLAVIVGCLCGHHERLFSRSPIICRRPSEEHQEPWNRCPAKGWFSDCMDDSLQILQVLRSRRPQSIARSHVCSVLLDL